MIYLLSVAIAVNSFLTVVLVIALVNVLPKQKKVANAQKKAKMWKCLSTWDCPIGDKKEFCTTPAYGCKVIELKKRRLKNDFSK